MGLGLKITYKKEEINLTDFTIENHVRKIEDIPGRNEFLARNVNSLEINGKYSIYDVSKESLEVNKLARWYKVTAHEESCYRKLEFILRDNNDEEYDSLTFEKAFMVDYSEDFNFERSTIDFYALIREFNEEILKADGKSFGIDKKLLIQKDKMNELDVSTVDGNNGVVADNALRESDREFAWDWVENSIASVHLNTIARLQYPWLFAASLTPVTAALIDYRIITSIARVENNKKYINNAATKYGVPNEIIGGIIFKEVLTQSLPDAVANIDTFFRNTPHSTGLGAIFPATARMAWELVDPSMVRGISDGDLQYRLSNNNEFNIKTIAAVLVYYAMDKQLINNPSEAKNLTRQQWKSVVARYNGSDEYARKVYEYLDYIEELLD